MGRVVPNLFVDEKKTGPSGNGNTEAKAETDDRVERLTFDRPGFLESVGNNPALAREVIELFMNHDSPRLVAALNDAVQRHDLKGVEEAAHALKGLFGELQATNAYEMSRKLEASAHTADERDLPARAAALFSEIETLKQQLRQLTESPHNTAP
jgi:HPt (histidine-containing phosphotransfer) domain-containing protein